MDDVASSKPKYRVPTMREIRKVKPNGFKLVSTFSGAGGSCLGFKMAGFETVWASEFIPAAVDVYKANFPDVPVDTRDIRTVSAQEILDAVGMERGELDVLEGSPPCASFSTSGRRAEGWGKVRHYSDGAQRVDDLFFEYVRLVEGLQPKVFVAENVMGLARGVAKGYFLEITHRLITAGYQLEVRALDAQWLGIPQQRERLIFVGVRSDLNTAPAFPTPLPYRYTLAEAVEGVVSTDEERRVASMLSTRSRPEESYAVAKLWRTLKVGEQHHKRFNLIRSHPDRPVQAILQSGGMLNAASVTHPHECRKFTIPELRRLCSFPDDFILTGSYRDQYERLGRAVPPLMMRAVAEAIRDDVLLREPVATST